MHELPSKLDRVQTLITRVNRVLDGMSMSDLENWYVRVHFPRRAELIKEANSHRSGENARIRDIWRTIDLEKEAAQNNLQEAGISQDRVNLLGVLAAYSNKDFLPSPSRDTSQEGVYDAFLDSAEKNSLYD